MNNLCQANIYCRRQGQVAELFNINTTSYYKLSSFLVFFASLRVFITGLQRSGSHIWLLNRLKATAKQWYVTRQKQLLDTRTAPSPSLSVVPPVVAMGVFTAAESTEKKYSRAALRVSEQVIPNYSGIQTACLLSQPLLYHSSSLSVLIFSRHHPETDFLGHRVPNVQLRHKCPMSYYRRKANRGLILLFSFSAAQQAYFHALRKGKPNRERLPFSATVLGMPCKWRNKSQLPSSCAAKGEVKTTLSPTWGSTCVKGWEAASGKGKVDVIMK